MVLLLPSRARDDYDRAVGGQHAYDSGDPHAEHGGLVGRRAIATQHADEVYALTAYLLFINDVIREDEVLDAMTLPKVKMPIGDNYASLPDWKPRTPRLKGYPQ